MFGRELPTCQIGTDRTPIGRVAFFVRGPLWPSSAWDLCGRARIPTGGNRPARESEHRMIRRMRQNGVAVQMTAYYLKKVEDLRMHELLTCLLRDETGVAGVEYGILIAAVVAALIVAASSVGGQIVANAFSLLSDTVGIACTSSCGNG